MGILINVLINVLLGCGVICLSYAINQNSLILSFVGGIFLSVYNSLYTYCIRRWMVTNK